jgi:regulatory protein YycI of two-component signal transduction system YycFG
MKENEVSKQILQREEIEPNFITAQADHSTAETEQQQGVITRFNKKKTKLIIVVVLGVVFLILLVITLLLLNKYNPVMNKDDTLIEDSIELNFEQDSIELNKEYRLAQNQVVTIVGTTDTFTIDSLVPCFSPESNCGIGAPSVSWEITTAAGIARGFCQACLRDGYNFKTAPPSKYDIYIIDTNYRSHATVKVIQNDNWEQDLADYLSRQEEQKRKDEEPQVKAK